MDAPPHTTGRLFAAARAEPRVKEPHPPRRFCLYRDDLQVPAGPRAHRAPALARRPPRRGPRHRRRTRRRGTCDRVGRHARQDDLPVRRHQGGHHADPAPSHGARPGPGGVQTRVRIPQGYGRRGGGQVPRGRREDRGGPARARRGDAAPGRDLRDDDGRRRVVPHDRRIIRRRGI